MPSQMKTKSELESDSTFKTIDNNNKFATYKQGKFSMA